MSGGEKAQVLQEVESSSGSKRKVLAGLGVSKSGCYRWRARHGQGSLEMKMAAGKEFHTKATRPHQMWVSDASHFRVSGWGFYYLVTVMDDFSTVHHRLETLDRHDIRLVHRGNPGRSRPHA